MINCAVLGSPITHSLSPKIHKKAYEILGVSASYSAIELDERTFPDFFAKLNSKESESDWSGFSLTMPLKEIVLKYCDRSDEFTRQIASANTLFLSDEQWNATSTDLLAFQNLLDIATDARVAIIGGGGTARAAIGALNSKVSSVDVLLRSATRLESLTKAAPALSVRALDMGASLNNYDLIIQTTPAGVFDEFVPNLKRADGTLLEALYAPWPTLLADKFQSEGGRVISGKELLVEQALFQIEIFSNLSFDFTSMRSLLLDHISSS